jgi:phenylalanyl-tRNA synthetase alpha chain
VALDADAETLGDGVREALGERAAMVEAIEVVSETPYAALPPAAISRMGLGPEQKNVLLRITLRALDRTLTHAECNALRDAIYATLHRGARSEWAASCKKPAHGLSG